ncbi:MAG: 5-oxoprolinase subunit PxpA [Saprospiraceae bacterium]
MTIDLNCDMGESFGRYSIGNDKVIMPLISSCNIACGYHGGDPKVIIDTIKMAQKHNVKIGAHPSYPDLQGFGRRRMFIPSDDLMAIIQYQISVIDKLSNIYSEGLHHVKVHGALYNHAYDDEGVARAIVQAMMPWKESTILYAQYGSVLARIAKEEGLRVMIEGFVDRRYCDDLNLMPRSQPSAVHTSIVDMIDQVLDIVNKNQIITPMGYQKINVQTICIHGDHPQAVEIVKKLTTALRNEGVAIN